MSSYQFSFAELKAISHDVTQWGRPLLTTLIPIAHFFLRLFPVNQRKKSAHLHYHSSKTVTGLNNETEVNLPRVKLVGAGPGDPDLLTIKAYNAIQNADIVLYDWLVSEAVLALIPRHVKREFVGKRAHRHSMTQTQIDRRLVELAQTGVNVVRLKGGDPAFFSRVNEEANALDIHGISYAIIPGITTASALTAYTGIALTQRNIARKVTFMTAQSADTPLNINLPDFCPEHTLVVYMGKNKLSALSKVLQMKGWPKDTPIAIVESVSLPQQIQCRGTLNNISIKAPKLLQDGPAIIVVGEVVSHSMQVSALLSNAH